MGRKKTEPKAVLANVTSRGYQTYAQEFIEVVVAHAMKQTHEEASVYYDVPLTTVKRWCKRYRSINEAASKRHVAIENPYRGTSYSLERRLALSDKLFAELDYTLELTRMKEGAVPADVLQKLVTAYGLLIDKRRLEEGAHTALVQAVKNPEEIYEAGDAKVVEFRRRAALPPGS